MRDVISHLRSLVGFDTTNPPRAITGDHGAVVYCADILMDSGFNCRIDDLGEGSVNLVAARGTPSVILNCHLDTVPVCDGWISDPFGLRVEGDVAIGLGACDIKGAAAALLTAAQRTTGDAMILLSTDEEAGSSRCVRSFLSMIPAGIKGAIVCEPTECGVVAAHRGLLSVEGVFSGTSTHASGAHPDSAIHSAVRWAAAALEWRDCHAAGTRFSIGRVEGGIKPNMVASSARLRYGLRPAVGVPADDQFCELCSLAIGMNAEWHKRFDGPTLIAHPDANMLAEMLGAAISDPVDFWTEASLFAEAGVPAVVFGPGSITNAHAPNELVPIRDLEAVTNSFVRILSGAMS